jgi:1,4-dihydroxy-2-naphthoyl-CoA hydrolase
MPFSYQRTIHFSDTDAAGVVFFANYASICHEAYEESLSKAGVNLNDFFKDAGVVIPISKCEADFKRPLHCGDKVAVTATPMALSDNSFEIRFDITRLGPPDKSAAHVRTEHVCIDSATRARKVLPVPIANWIAKSPTDSPLESSP